MAKNVILLRYYNTYKDMHVNISRLYSELGPKGTIFTNSKKVRKTKKVVEKDIKPVGT
jgi:hypothetical protein